MVARGRRPLAYLAAVLACAATPAAADTSERTIENGTATWYGGRHVGRSTSSGEVFTATELTAAHPYLPLGTRVRVTVADTGSSVVVKINDRQPVHGNRIIDLSRAAASRLGMLSRGAAPVTITAVGTSVDETEPVEVAMAPEGAGPMAFGGSDDDAFSARPRGRPRMHHARRAAWAARR